MYVNLSPDFEVHKSTTKRDKVRFKTQNFQTSTGKSTSVKSTSAGQHQTNGSLGHGRASHVSTRQTSQSNTVTFRIPITVTSLSPITVTFGNTWTQRESTCVRGAHSLVEVLNHRLGKWHKRLVVVSGNGQAHSLTVHIPRRCSKVQ